MKNRRVFAVIGILGIAILLAFPLRDAVYASIIIPLAYVLWVLGLVYHSVDQVIWWFIVFFILLVLFSRSLLPQFKARKFVPHNARPEVGKVEGLSEWMKKADHGIYFKWLVANRLGKIAHQILARRDTNRQRSMLDPLAGPDWNPQRPIQAYLEAGLHGSFADYPQRNRFFSRPAKTPMDQDMDEVIEYLEMQIDEGASHLA